MDWSSNNKHQQQQQHKRNNNRTNQKLPNANQHTIKFNDTAFTQ
jgi:hypothetical protein